MKNLMSISLIVRGKHIMLHKSTNQKIKKYIPQLFLYKYRVYYKKKLHLFELAQPTHTMTCHIYCVWHVAVLLNQRPMCASLYPFGYEIPLARMLSPYLTANNSTCNIYTFWECDVCHINIVALLSHTHTHAIK